jgi:hypothetical protein
MSPVEIAFLVVSVLMLLSRFVSACKPLWGWMPKVVAVLLPPVVLMLPHLADLWHQTTTLGDLMWYLIAALVMLVVGWFR